MRNLPTLSKKGISIFFALVLSILLVNNVKSANYYWVGDGGDWSDFGTHWATTSGGAVFHIQPPTPLDDVYFDANSFTMPLQIVNIDIDINCRNLDWTAVTNNPIFDGMGMMRIFGSLTLSPGMNFPYMNGIDFLSFSPGNTIDFAGHALMFWGLNFTGGGDWTLMSDVDMTAGGGMIWIDDGILKTNGYTVSVSNINGNMTPTAGLELGSSTVNLQWFWFMQPFQFDAGTSTLNLDNNFFQGNGYKWANVNMVPTFPGGAFIQGSTIFDTLTFNANIDNIGFEDNTIQELKDMQIISDCANPVTISSDGDMSFIKKIFGTVNLDYINVRNMTIIGGASFISDFSSDLGNVVNWTINSPAPTNYYWVGGTGNWNDPMHWSLSSGGAPLGTCVPSAVDNVFFDANSFTAPGQAVSIISGAVCNNMDWTGVTNSPDLNGGWPAYLGINGSFTLDAGMTYNYTSELIFVSQNIGNTITTAGISLTGQINFEGSGEWTLMDDFTTTSQITYNQGSLITNNNALTMNSLYSYSQLTKIIDLGSSIVTVNNSWQIQDNTNFTIIPGTSTIDFNGTWFRGGDLTYNNVNFNNATNTTIYGSNTFNVMSINNGSIVSFEGGATQTVQDISLSGDCANWSSIRSYSVGTTTNISAIAGIINIDFTNIQDITVAGGATFNANNSIDLGNNTGWVFTPPVATTYYWIGDNGNWNDPAHWSLASGGVSAGCIPSGVDNVIFDDNSGIGAVNITINVNATCNDIDFSASTTARNLYGTNTLSIFGSLLFSNTVTTNNYSGNIYFKSNTPGETINTAGRRVYSNVYFDGAADWTLLGNLTLNIISTPYRSIYLDKGTLNTNGYLVTARAMYSSTENVRQLIMGNSTFNTDYWQISNETNFSSVGGTSTINMNSGYFYGGGGNYFNVNNAYTSNLRVFGSNTFNNFVVPSITELQIEGGTTQTFASIAMPNGTGCNDFMEIKSDNPGTPANLIMAAGIHNGDYLKISDVTAGGGATFNATNSIGTGDVTGWIITPYPGKKLYWVGDGGNWDDPAHWSLTSGGAGGACVPTSQDSVYFDANSFSALMQVVNINIVASCRLMDWTGATFFPELAGWQNITIEGPLTLIPAINYNYWGQFIFTSGIAGNNIITAGHMLSSIIFSGSGTYTLQDDLNVENMITINNGTLNTNDKTIDMSSFGGGINFNGASTRIINLGSSVINCDAWNVNDNTNLTINAGTSVINLSNNAWQFNGGDQTYNEVSIQKMMFGGGTNIYGSNTFNTLTILPGATVMFEEGTTQTLTNFNTLGNIGNNVTIQSTNDGVQATLNKPADFCGDYLNLQDINATGAVFNAGANSVDNGNNTGWIFGTFVANDQYPAYCEDSEGLGSTSGIDYTVLDNAINGGTANPVNWFEDVALVTPVPDPTNVTSNDGDTLYAQVISGACDKTAFVYTTIIPLPTALDQTPAVCEDTYLGGVATAQDLTLFEAAIDAGAGTTITWFEDAGLSIPVVTPANIDVTNGEDYFAQVDDGNCLNVAQVTYTVNTLPLVNNQTPAVCEDVFGGGTAAGQDLTALEAAIDGGSGFSFNWYEDAGLTTPVATPANVTVSDADDFYAEVDDGTCINVASVVYTVDGQPVANDQTPAVCEDVFGGGTTAAQDLTTMNAAIDGGAGTTITWYEDAGLTIPVATPTNVTVSNADDFYSLVDDGTCTNVAVVTYTVDGKPVANDQTPSECEDVFGGASASGVDLTALNAAVDGGAGNTITWYEDAGLTTPVATPANVTVPDGEDYYAEVDDGTCTNVAMVTYTITTLPTVTNQTPSVCEDVFGGGSAAGQDLTALEAAIDGGSGFSFTWYEDAGLLLLVATPANVTVINGTDYYAEVDDGTCINVASVVYTVDPLPVANDQTPSVCEDVFGGGTTAAQDLTAMEAAIDGGAGNTILWYEDAGLTTPVATPANVTVSDADDFYALVDDGTCTDVAAVTYTVNGQPVANDQSPALCEDVFGGGTAAAQDLTAMEVAIDGGAGNTITWYEDAGLTTPVATPVNVTVSDADDFYAEVDDGTCTNVATITYTINGQPVANDQTPEVCEDTEGSGSAVAQDLTAMEAAIDGGAGATITWYEDAGLITLVGTPANVTVNDADDFYAEVDNGTCINVASVVYTVRALPIAADQTPTICEDAPPGSGIATGVDITVSEGAINGGGGISYTWYEDAGLITPVPDPANVDLSDADDFYVLVDDGSCTNVAAIVYTVSGTIDAFDQTVDICEDALGSGTATAVNLRDQDFAIDGGAGHTIDWYTDAARTLAVPDPTDVDITGVDTFYVRVTSGTCTNVAMVDYTVNTLPDANDQTPVLCEDAFGSGSASAVDLTALDAAVDGGAGNTVTWFEDAGLLTPVGDPTNVIVPDGEDYFAEVDDGICTNVALITYTINGQPVANNQTPSLCEDVFGGGTVAGIDLTALDATIDGGAGTTITWYEDAGLSTPVATPANVTVSDADDFYAQVDDATCINVASVTYTINGLPVANDQTPSLCEDAFGGGTVAAIDLTALETAIDGGAGNTVNWFEDAGLTTPVGDPANVNVPDGEDYFAEVDNGTCTNVAVVTYTIDGQPVANDQTPDVCEDSEGAAVASGQDLTALEAAIDGGAGHTITWYEDPTLIIPVATPANVTVIDGEDYFAEVDDGTCINVASVTYNVHIIPEANDQTPAAMCEDVFGAGEVAGIDLTALEAAIDGGAGNTVNWYSDAGLTVPIVDPTDTIATNGLILYAEVDNGFCTNSATVTYIVNGQPVANDQTPASLCEDTYGAGTVAGIDLTALEAAIDGGAGNTVIWFEDAGLTVPVGDPTDVIVSDAQEFYADVDDGTCTNTAIVTYSVLSRPDANPITPTLCEDAPGSGTAAGIDLTLAEPVINPGGGLLFNWYEDVLLTTPVGDPSNATVNDEDTLYIEVDDGNCTNIAMAVYSVTGVITASDQYEAVCEDTEGSSTVAGIDLTLLDNDINGGSGIPVSWFEDIARTVPVGDPTNVTVVSADTFYIEMISGTCSDTAEVIYLINPLPAAIDQTPEVCEDTLGTGNAYGVDLTGLNIAIDGGAGNTVTWFNNISLTDTIVDPTDVIVSNAQIFYAQVDNVDCYQVATITYTVNTLPDANDIVNILCEDVSGGGTVSGIDLTALEATVDGGAGNTITWYEDAGLITAVTVPTDVIVSDTDDFFVLVDDGTCTNIAVVNYTVNSKPTSNDIAPAICEDTPGSGVATGADLTIFEFAISNDTANLTYTWYSDAGLTTPIADAVNATVNDMDILYVDVNNGDCSDTAIISFSVGNVITAIDQDLDICETTIGSLVATGYDLTQHELAIRDGLPSTVAWYSDAGLTTPIADPTDATLTGTDTVFAEVSSGACSSTALVEYQVRVIPNFSLGADQTIAPTASLILDPGSTYSSYLWSTGDTTENITVDANVLGIGVYNYSLSVVNVFGCLGSDTIEITVAVIDNINKENSNLLVEIYPNPASSIITIKAPINTTISIIDVYGRVMDTWENKTASKTLEVNNYSSGLYFIKISEKDITETLKLIIE